MLHIRDDAFGSLDGAPPAFTVDTVTDYTPEQDSKIARQVQGSFTVPNYLNTPTGSTGSTFNYVDVTKPGVSDQPARLGGVATLRATYTCDIPRSASDAAPATLSLYGHGLLGGQDEVDAGNVKSMANEHNFAFCATDWIGMATEDVPTVASILVDMSNFPKLADRVQQGMLNFLFLARLMKDQRAFAANAAFQSPGASGTDGKPLIEAGTVYYDGNSQGGIIGGALMAVAQDVHRGVLGVPGMNYSTLLNRSTDWATYSVAMYNAYPDKLDQQLIFALIQMLWDRAEADGYAAHMTTRPLPDTPSHRVLMHPAFGDHQVANVAAEVEARTIGARIHWPALEDGRSHEVVPFWGIDPIETYPYAGSAMVIWDSGTPAPPDTNTAPSQGDDPHGMPRAQPAARTQKATFLRTGNVIDVCGGAPCHPAP
jgi:hypothetical protein